MSATVRWVCGLLPLSHSLLLACFCFLSHKRVPDIQVSLFCTDLFVGDGAAHLLPLRLRGQAGPQVRWVGP